tara:strand:- start:1001 stop:2005 length:1005 start_codon:yes stop_codon:yes gene_type:complete
MAFKLTVDYQNLRLVIDTDSVESVSVFQHLKSTVDYQDLRQILAYQNLTAAEVAVDADTINQYFTAQYDSPNAESFSFTDSDIFTLGKVLGDTSVITEQLANAMQKAVADTAQLSENLSRVVYFGRTFTETANISEAHTYTFSKASADTFSFTEAQVFVTTKLLADTYGFADSQVLNVERLSEDSFSFADDFSRVVPYVRSFADTYGLDDTASASDDLATQSNLNKTNVVSMAEASAFAFTPGTIAEGFSVEEAYTSSFVPATIAEGIDVAESYVASFARGVVAETLSIAESAIFSILPVFADTATINESIDVELIKGVGPLNNSALNLNMLNA